MSKTDRFTLRLPQNVKPQVQYAADLSGLSLRDFILTSALAAAEAVIREHEVIVLTGSESQRLVAALLNPPLPNARLRAAIQDYENFAGVDWLVGAAAKPGQE